MLSLLISCFCSLHIQFLQKICLCSEFMEEIKLLKMCIYICKQTAHYKSSSKQQQKLLKKGSLHYEQTQHKTICNLLSLFS